VVCVGQADSPGHIDGQCDGPADMARQLRLASGKSAPEGLGRLLLGGLRPSSVLRVHALVGQPQRGRAVDSLVGDDDRAAVTANPWPRSAQLEQQRHGGEG
jgi:hypothetical protein